MELAKLLTNQVRGLLAERWDDAATEKEKAVRVNRMTELNDAYCELEDALYDSMEVLRKRKEE